MTRTFAARSRLPALRLRARLGGHSAEVVVGRELLIEELGRQIGRREDGPSAITNAYSMTLRSSRTVPGQSLGE